MQKTFSFLILSVFLAAFTTTGCGFNPADTQQCSQQSDCPAGMQCSGRFCFPAAKMIAEAKGGTEKSVTPTEQIGENPQENANNEPLQREEVTTDAGEPSTPDKPVPETDTDNTQDPCAKLTTLGQECTVKGTKGICVTGTIQCVSGAEVCISKNKPGLEVCDGKDNDCDGDIDENLGQLTCGQGECRVTIDKCQNGKAATCTPKASKPETCNMKDDDCDGSIDEGVPNCCMPGETKACGNSTVGECKLGTRTCDQSRKWSSCTGGVTPVNEICDGKDNDCNGLVDDGLPVLSCGPPGSACFNQVKSCIGGKAQNCTPKNGVTEVCDGKDNDCDGQTDEGLPDLQCGNGPCKTIIGACLNGKTQTCVPNSNAKTPETCNMKDDDCDGNIDNVPASKLASDLKNCGKCGNICPTPPNATATCSTGKCRYVCKTGWRDLDGTGGCETQRSAALSDPNIVLHYDCEGISASKIVDKSGKGNHGTAKGVYGSTTRQLFGSACYFGGWRKQIDISSSSSILAGKTISIWAYTQLNEVKDRRALFFWNDDTPTITFLGGKWLHILNQSGSKAIFGAKATASWTHHGITYNGNTVCSYINGALVKCETSPGLRTGTNIVLGGDPATSTSYPDRYFRGYLDEIWISSRIYTAKELKKYYEKTRP